MYYDIKNTEPNRGDQFFVDTNVWFWVTYVASKTFVVNKPQDYQIDHYPKFIESAINNNSELFYSPLTLVELASLIERSEWQIYKGYTGNDINLKKFRSIAVERKAVVEEIKMAWDTIKNMAKELSINLDSNISTFFIDAISDYKIDGYDALYYKIMKQNNLDKIITDDKDFRSIPDIDCYGCYPK